MLVSESMNGKPAGLAAGALKVASGGTFAIVTMRWAGMRWTQLASGGLARQTRTFAAYGEVVWSWRRDRGVYFAGGIPQTTVTKNAAHRGEHEGNRKTIARGKPV